MADLSVVMDELGAALDVIDGLRVFPYFADKIVPPCALVGWPDAYDFDQTMQRGSDRVVLPVLVAVGRFDARTSRDRLATYAAGSGDHSIKQAVEQHTATTWHSARVQGAEFGSVRIGGADYLAATFNVEIMMRGAS